MSDDNNILPPCGGPALPSELVCLVLDYLSPNDIALAGRFTCQEAARRFSSAHYRTASLIKPLAAHAARFFQLNAQPRMRLLTFRKKLGLTAIAAASGSEVNMAVAWSLLQPQLFLELLPPASSGLLSGLLYATGTKLGDPGSVACERGHHRLVHWMVQHVCPLSPTRTLAAAARHCDLGALRDLWQLLRSLPGSFLRLDQHVLGEAVASTTPDALAKAEWVLAEGAGSCELTPTIACTVLETAASSSTSTTSDTIRSSSSGGGGGSGSSSGGSGSSSSGGGSSSGGSNTVEAFMRRLHWLRRRGCSLHGYDVLSAALLMPMDGFLTVVDSLLGSPGAQLLWDGGGGEGGGGGSEGSLSQLLATGRGDCWKQLTHSALSAAGSAAKLRWLHERGVELDHGTLHDAVQRGNLEALVYLHEECGLPLLQPHGFNLMPSAVGSGSIPTAAWLLQAGCPVHVTDLWPAVHHGRSDMVQWLVQEARCPVEFGNREPDALLPLQLLVQEWNRTPLSDDLPKHVMAHDACHGVGDDASLLATVQLMLDAGSGVDFSTLCMAVDRGDLPLVRLLHGTGACRSARYGTAQIALNRAARPGCEALLDFLVKEGYVMVEDPMNAYAAAYAHAAKAGDLGMLMALRRLGVPWGRGTLSAAVRVGWPPEARGAPLCVLRWMVEQCLQRGRQQGRCSVGIGRWVWPRT